MKILDKYTFCFALLPFLICCHTTCPPEPPSYTAYCFLVNNTDDLLYYEYEMVHWENVIRTFEISLFPSDTFFIGETYITEYESNNFSDNYMFYGKTIIKNSNEDTVFIAYNNYKCGVVDFVLDDKHDDVYYYYWVIDSAYIADKSCSEATEEWY